MFDSGVIVPGLWDSWCHCPRIRRHRDRNAWALPLVFSSPYYDGKPIEKLMALDLDGGDTTVNHHSCFCLSREETKPNSRV
jgi:hypothetical protein